MSISSCVSGQYWRDTALIVTSDSHQRQELGNALAGGDYRVLAAASADEALAICRYFEGAIHLLVAEENSPGDSAWTLAEVITKIRPGIVVLFLSQKTSVAPNALLRVAGTLARRTQRQSSRRVN